jgi:hypothetical protein
VIKPDISELSNPHLNPDGNIEKAEGKIGYMQARGDGLKSK